MWNNGAALDGIVALVETIGGIQQVYRGAPESLGPRVSAYVGVGVPEFPRKAVNNLMSRVQPFIVGFGYRVKGAEADAEDTLAAYLDAFPRAFYADPTLGGAVDSAELARSGQLEPDYRMTAGVEIRVCELVLLATQYEQIPLQIGG